MPDSTLAATASPGRPAADPTVQATSGFTHEELIARRKAEEAARQAILEEGRRQGEELADALAGGAFVFTGTARTATTPEGKAALDAAGPEATGAMLWAGSEEDRQLWEHAAASDLEARQKAVRAEARETLRLRMEADAAAREATPEPVYEPIPEAVIEHVVSQAAEWAAVCADGYMTDDGRWVPNDPAARETLPGPAGHETFWNVRGTRVRADQGGFQEHRAELFVVKVGADPDVVRYNLRKVRWAPNRPLRLEG